MLRYAKSVCKYFFDKGPYLVLLSILPSLLTALLFSPTAPLDYLLRYRDINFADFGVMYADIHRLPYDFFYVGIIGMVFYVVAFALMFGIVDRHMRIGEFTLSFKRAKTRLNYNIMTALRFSLGYGIFFLLADLLLAVLYYLWAVAFGAGAEWLVFSIISWLLVSGVQLYISTRMLLWAPFMLHTGLRSYDAFRMGWRQMSGRMVPAAVALFFVVLPADVLTVLIGALTGNIVWRVIADGIIYSVVLTVYVVLMYTVFYDVTGTERMDLRKIDLWSKRSWRWLKKKDKTDETDG